jgi:hypothetical protein
MKLSRNTVRKYLAGDGEPKREQRARGGWLQMEEVLKGQTKRQ